MSLFTVQSSYQRTRGLASEGMPLAWEPMAQTKLSQEAYDRLKDELTILTTEGRIKIANAIEAARALGDLSENGDYHAAKDDQGKMESRIRQISAMLEGATIVENTSSGVVDHGSVVGIKYEGDDDVEWYLIGSIEERRDDVAVMSPNSPLGQALLGHKPGDVVSYEAPSGELRVEIIEIKS
jgi:transcription elongation factor GreA